MNKAKRESTRSNDKIYILGPKDMKARVIDITCYMCTLIIKHKTSIIYNLNKIFILEK